jgi:DNA (cytosine-5)-methyltransferase 1
MLNGLDLFSGIGGLTLALSPWVRPIAYCENDRYAQGVLLSRMADGSLAIGPIWDDVRTLRRENLGRGVDIIYGGFPCQGISSCGTRKGLDDQRSGIFFEMLRLAKEIKPPFIFLENVPTIRARGLETIGRELAYLGYDCRWDIVAARSVGAPHIRKRWFCLAYAKGFGALREIRDISGENEAEKRSEITRENQARKLIDASWWPSEPRMGRMAYGLPNRVDRVKCLGNSVVPLQAREAFKKLSGII